MLKTDKKSQMEILGLAIVVVLILIATVFVVKFLLLRKPTDYRNPFITAELASNMLSTFLKTAADDCSMLTMTELLQDCAQGKAIVCNNGQDSCSYVASTASYVFSQTFDKMNMNYEFLTYYNENSPLIRLGKTCTAEKRSKLFPIPISSATMYAKLDICG